MGPDCWSSLTSQCNQLLALYDLAMNRSLGNPWPLYVALLVVCSKELSMTIQDKNKIKKEQGIGWDHAAANILVGSAIIASSGVRTCAADHGHFGKRSLTSLTTSRENHGHFAKAVQYAL